MPRPLPLVSLLGMSLCHAMPADGLWSNLTPQQVVIIQGRMAPGTHRAWSTYQNGQYASDLYSGHFFKVPSGRTLVLVEAAVTFAGDRRKTINLEFNLHQGAPGFPLARATFRNPSGAHSFTAVRSFNPGLVLAPGSQLNVVEPTPGSGQYEIVLYGFYSN